MAETSGGDLPDGTSEIFLARGLDDPNHVDWILEISLCEHGLRVFPASLRVGGFTEIDNIALVSASDQENDARQVSGRKLRVSFRGGVI
jgi:hypothetical protein